MKIPDEMLAMVVAATGRPLEPRRVPVPRPGPGEVLLEVAACGVCRTDLHLLDGELPEAPLPVIPGHEIVGRVVAVGDRVDDLAIGERVGVPWLGWTCGECRYCRMGRENLCDNARFTGYTLNGGYAQFAVADRRYCFRLPSGFGDLEAAPLLCAGAIGYRSLMLSAIRDGDVLGLTGFGGSAHLVLKMVRHRLPRTRVHVFARSAAEQAFARELGACWAGGTDSRPPELLDAVIDTTPAWKPVVSALAHLKSGGRLVINAIRKEDADKGELLKLDYAVHLWQEKQIKSVANVTRRDVREFLALAADIPIRPEIQEYPLEEANRALVELKERKIRGAKVLRIG
jgi:propanol-preferring alcohol dehydrogenase